MADDIIDRLLRIQDQDLRITEWERELAAMPKRIKALDKQLDTYRDSIAAAEEQRTAAQLEVKKLEIEDQDQRQKIARFREQQMTLKTNREFRAMEEEIALVQRRISQLETQLLEAMETVEQRSQEVDACKRELAQAGQNVEQEKAALITHERQIEDDLEKLKHQRAIDAQTLPDEWLKPYDRLFKSKRDSVLVNVANGFCSGCHMKLPPAVNHAARRSESMVTCDFCGRMLYSDHRMT